MYATRYRDISSFLLSHVHEKVYGYFPVFRQSFAALVQIFLSHLLLNIVCSLHLSLNFSTLNSSYVRNISNLLKLSRPPPYFIQLQEHQNYGLIMGYLLRKFVIVT